MSRSRCHTKTHASKFVHCRRNQPISNHHNILWKRVIKYHSITTIPCMALELLFFLSLGIIPLATLIVPKWFPDTAIGHMAPPDAVFPTPGKWLAANKDTRSWRWRTCADRDRAIDTRKVAWFGSATSPNQRTCSRSQSDGSRTRPLFASVRISRRLGAIIHVKAHTHELT